MKKYIKLAENSEATSVLLSGNKARSSLNVNYLEVEIYYSLGGMNYFTGKMENRGYFLRVAPVEKRGNLISFEGFSGIKQCIKPVARKSAKAEAEAEKLAAQYEENLINYVLQQNNLQLAESEKIA